MQSGIILVGKINDVMNHLTLLCRWFGGKPIKAYLDDRGITDGKVRVIKCESNCEV